MRAYSTILILVITSLSSCKKNYTCECTNTNGTYVAGEVEATKSKAKKHCEGLSTNNTACIAK